MMRVIFCAFLITAQVFKAPIQAEEILTCENDYRLTINCHLKSTDSPTATENAPSWLEFVLKHISSMVFNCSLIRGTDGDTCSFKAHFLHGTFASFHNFKISLCKVQNGHPNCSVLDPHYYPSKNIKPDTPKNFTMDAADGNYVFTWTSGYENHNYFKSLPFLSVFSYHKEGHPSIVSELTLQSAGENFSLKIPETSLEPDTQYIAKVRNKIFGHVYNGTWSDWSTANKWKTKHTVLIGEGLSEVALLQPTVIVLVLSCIAVAIAFLLLYPIARTKIKKTSLVATPSPFFQSLYQNHQGNFKDWVLKRNMQQTYIEEISTIDQIETAAVEQNQAKPLAVYAMTQYPTPYVSPTAEVWVPLQMADTHSAARISCKDLDFQPEESAVEEPMLGLTTFEPIVVEGLPCMEDLEFGPEDLEPSETLTFIPKPACFNQNYCTLTNTSIGLIPTLVTGLCEPETVSDSHAVKEPLPIQTEESASEPVKLSLHSLQLSMEE